MAQVIEIREFCDNGSNSRHANDTSLIEYRFFLPLHGKTTMHKLPLRTKGLELLMLALAVGTSGAAVAKQSVCEFVTSAEATRLLGTPAGKKSASVEKSVSGCLIPAAEGSDTLRLSVITLPEGS